ncbi:MAG TPA: amidohydrolase family protein [Ramlibacter sp.]|nr:amidohydrolase family protein [Ramlibacter sp.]
MTALAQEFKVIDTDTHIIEPYDLWTSRVSKKWGDQVPHVKWDERKQEDAWFFGTNRVSAAAGAAHAGFDKYPPSRPQRLDQAQKYTWDAKERLKVMDEYGIHAQILYPNVAGFGAGEYLALGDKELMLACVQAYNDWITEWASADPKRLVPQMALPFWDVQTCVVEMQRMVKHGHKGVVMCGEPEHFKLPKLTDPHWDPLWAAAQEMGLPINFHIGTGDMFYYKMMHRGVGRHAHFASMGALFSMDNAKVIAQLICGGVCHRFPSLNFVSVESGVGWLPYLLDGLDYQWKNCGVAEEHPEYKLLPSEFFKRQFYGSFWFEERTLKSAIEQLGADNILYETDFPHPTSMSPGPCSSAVKPSQYIELALKGISREDAGKILYGNAARIYHLD